MRSDLFLEAPQAVTSSAARDFDQLLREVADRNVSSPGVSRPIDLTGRSSHPVWQLLVHAAATGRFALHGSGVHDIVEFEPRQSNDVEAFGNRQGVYAAADGLWPFYFAIVDRTKITSLINGAFYRLDPSAGAERGPFYFFSVDSPDPRPWREGTVYLLPLDGFERQTERSTQDGTVRSTQLFHPGPVRPLARVRVRPVEFPLLEAIRRHDSTEVSQRVAADPDGFPWV